jgi:hypothetical protein
MFRPTEPSVRSGTGGLLSGRMLTIYCVDIEMLACAHNGRDRYIRKDAVGVHGLP